jgi:hypothetical protein
VTTRVRATLADGTTVTGPVRGLGGIIAHRPTVERLVDLWHAGRRRQTEVVILPGYCAEEDGEPVTVPIAGTRFEVV